MKLLRDNETILENCDWVDVYAYIHRHHSYSATHALAYEGYKVVE